MELMVFTLFTVASLNQQLASEIWEAVGKKPQPPPPPPPPPNGSGEAWPRLWNMFGTTGICVVSKANPGQDIFRSFYIDIDLL